MRFPRFLAFLTSGLLLSATVWSQPSRPLTVVVPFNPGGTSDIIMRALAPKMSDVLGLPVVIENKAGANGALGAAQVARAAPDGHTLLIAPIGTYAINPTLNKSVRYDPRRDFDLLTIAVRTPNVLVVPASLPVNSFAELVARMKANPGKVAFASSGTGSTDHLTAALLWKRTGVTGVHVPYKGGGQAVTDLLAGHVDAFITNLGTLSGYIKTGKLKPLAVTSGARVPSLPDVPTLAELGIQDFQVYGWQGIVAPRGVPPDALARVRGAILAALKDPQVRSAIEPMGFEVHGSDSEEFARAVEQETARWKAVIESEDIRLE